MPDQIQQDARPGEALESEALQSALDASVPSFGALRQVRQFKSGYSNLTYLLEGEGNKLVLRRPPFGPRAVKAHDMVRGVSSARGLAQVGVRFRKTRLAVR